MTFVTNNTRIQLWSFLLRGCSFDGFSEDSRRSSIVDVHKIIKLKCVLHLNWLNEFFSENWGKSDIDCLPFISLFEFYLFYPHRVVTEFIYFVCVYFKYVIDGRPRTAHLLFPYRVKNWSQSSVKLTFTFRFKDECCLCRVESYIFQEIFLI